MIGSLRSCKVIYSMDWLGGTGWTVRCVYLVCRPCSPRDDVGCHLSVLNSLILSNLPLLRTEGFFAGGRELWVSAQLLILVVCGILVVAEGGRGPVNVERVLSHLQHLLRFYLISMRCLRRSGMPRRTTEVADQGKLLMLLVSRIWRLWQVRLSPSLVSVGLDEGRHLSHLSRFDGLLSLCLLGLHLLMLRGDHLVHICRIFAVHCCDVDGLRSEEAMPLLQLAVSSRLL